MRKDVQKNPLMQQRHLKLEEFWSEHLIGAEALAYIIKELDAYEAKAKDQSLVKASYKNEED